MEEAIKVGWELEEAEGKLQRSKLSRIEILQQAARKPCAAGCKMDSG